MFEKAMPVPRSHDCDEMYDDLPDDMLVGSRDRVPGIGGDAMRAIEWSELTARLNAARDLRRVLRRDARHSIEATAASFGDAAATYFQSLGDGEQPVNPVALEAPKASRSTVRSLESDAATGDAREE